MELIHKIYPNGNHGTAELKAALPPARNCDTELSLTSNAFVIDDDGAVGFSSSVSLTVNIEQIRNLANFLNKLVVRLEDLPEEA